MYRPNGIAVVTAGLGALVVFHVFWSWGGHSEPQPEPSFSPPSVMSDAGAILQLHSGAWRPQPAGDAEAVAEIKSAPAAPPAIMADMSTPVTVVSTALPIPATAASTASSTTVRSVPVQQISARTQAPMLPPEAEASAEKAPLASTADPVAAGPAPAPPEGRMALAGPDVEKDLPPPATNMARMSSAPRTPAKTHTLALPAEVPTLAPAESKFGPGNFKEFDRNGY